MAQPIQVDFTGVESGGGRKVHVPEGDYAFEVKKVKYTAKSESSGKPYLTFHLKLTKGPKKGINKTIQHICSLSKNSLWNLRNLLEACGVQVPSKAVKIDPDKFVGKKGAGTVVDGDEYEGHVPSIFAGFFPESELVESDESETPAEEEEQAEEEEEKPKSSKKTNGKGKKEETEEEEESSEGEEEEELFE